MTREQLDQELEPLEWGSADFAYHDTVAYSSLIDGWYRISKKNGKYEVSVDSEGDGFRTLLKDNIDTIEEAKAVAWNDYIGDVMDLFRIEP
nr:MAG TPA: hypothetical protein [Crassvirales sp.]